MANDSISCKKLLRSVSILPVCAIKVSLRVLDLREPHEYEVGLISSSSRCRGSLVLTDAELDTHPRG